MPWHEAIDHIEILEIALGKASFVDLEVRDRHSVTVCAVYDNRRKVDDVQFFGQSSRIWSGEILTQLEEFDGWWYSYLGFHANCDEKGLPVMMLDFHFSSSADLAIFCGYLVMARTA